MPNGCFKKTLKENCECFQNYLEALSLFSIENEMQSGKKKSIY